MKAIAKIGNLISNNDKMIIFHYYSPIALEQVKQELWRIGYPIRHFKFLSTLSPNLQGDSSTETAFA